MPSTWNKAGQQGRSLSGPPVTQALQLLLGRVTGTWADGAWDDGAWGDGGPGRCLLAELALTGEDVGREMGGCPLPRLESSMRVESRPGPAAGTGAGLGTVRATAQLLVPWGALSVTQDWGRGAQTFLPLPKASADAPRELGTGGRCGCCESRPRVPQAEC